MASRARWDPFREIAQLHDELSRLVGLGGRGEGGGQTVMPPADVLETQQEVIYSFDLPGVSEDRISIELENDTLTVSAEREPASDAADAQYHRRERRSGTYSRTIAVPQGTGEQQVSASYENGVLEVRIKKQEAPKPTKIKIGLQKPES
jgi:HSP20 family protein